MRKLYLLLLTTLLFSFGLVQAQSSCQAGFLYITNGCPTIQFTDVSTCPPNSFITSWSWSFGDGGSSNTSMPQHTYTANGTYLVCLTIGDNNGRASTYCDTVTIGCIGVQACSAGYQYTLGGCPTASFFGFANIASSTDSVIAWNWTFGDGSSGFGQNASHTYTQNGSYVACLNILTMQGCQSTFCDTINISCIQQTTCSAFYQYTLGNCPSISFFGGGSSSQVGDSVVSFSWNFGDGGSATGPVPTHTYTANGTYLACLNVAFASGCQATYCDTITIGCISQQNCSVGFQYTLNGCPTAQFFSNAATSPNDSILGYSWSFGDGSNGSGPSPSHTYTANGTYVACVSILTAQGCQATFCDSVTISCIPQSTCSAFYQYTFGNCPTISFFGGGSSSQVGDSVLSYSWTFGDGGSATGPVPTHTYSQNGLYVACLNVVFASGCQATFCDTLAITCIPPTTCSVGYQYTLNGCPTVQFFSNAATNPNDTIVSYTWNFGDGNSGTGPSTSHTYGQNGVYLACVSIVTAQGCQATFCDTITISCIQQASCNAAFQWTFGTNGCPRVDFVDNSSATPGNIVNWDWSFGDGGAASLQNPSHTYTQNGTYVACLTITTSDTCISTYCDTITISCVQPPSCSVGYQYTLGNCPTVSFFSFANLIPATDSVVVWNWSFGDGSSSGLANPTHTYSQNGTYGACVSILTSSGCQATFCDTITISCIQQASCNAAFQWTFGANGCPTVSFQDFSTSSPGNITNWSWSFGDGGTSGQASPTHTYSANGNYLVCLDIFTADSCTSTFCDTITISCIQPSSCSVGYQYTLGNCPAVSFFGFANVIPSTDTVVSWNWSFGDGGSGTGANPTHTYSQNGTYVACVSILTSSGCQATYCDTLNITCIQQASCNAAFQWTFGPNGCPTVSFQDFSTSSPGNIIGWNWSFGDGGTSGQASPTHTYSANGNYLVCLDIFTTDSCTSTFCDTITISCIQPPSCSVGYQYTLGNCPAVSFFGFANVVPVTDTVVSWNWSFGDGGTGTGASPTHTYSQNGTYVACVSILTSSGCQATYCDTLNITCITQPSCGAAFQWTFGPNGCPTVQFSDFSTANPGNIIDWAWSFGDGNTSSQQNPLHTYNTNGSFLACLTVTSSDSCTSTYCDTVRISCITQSVCQAAFQWTAATSPTIPFFDASTASPGNIISWSWNFGDGGTSVLQNPVYTYGADGTYIACLTISTDDNCTSTFCDSVTVFGTVGQEELPGINTIRLFPVPAKDVLHLQLDLTQSEAVALEMVDLTGKILWMRPQEQFVSGNHQLAVPVSSLSQGMYFLRVRSEQGVAVRKVLIER